MHKFSASSTEKKNWYKLDLSANVYPTLQRRNFSSVFRLSVTLKEKIDPVLLQEAFARTIPRFPIFASAIRSGLFWRYLEPNPRPLPRVQEDISNPCMPMPFKSNNEYLIRIYYFENTISFEAFHSLTDGTGGLYFLRTLTAVYLRLKGYDIPDGQGVLDITQPPDPEELEDSYMRYARSRYRPKRSQERAYRLRGTREPFYTLNIISGTVPTDILKETASRYQASVTEYLNAVLLYALMQEQKSRHPFREHPLKLALPVNLRRFFPSRTMRNFISMVYPSIDPRMGDYSFEDIVVQVHHYMRYYINNKFLNADITTNASTRNHPVIRLVPLFVKDIFVRQFYIRVQDKQSSAGLTNLGPVEASRELAEHVEQFEALMGQPFSARTNCAIVSFQNRTVISFASSIVETDIEKLFFRKLIRDGIPVKIKSNRDNSDIFPVPPLYPAHL